MINKLTIEEAWKRNPDKIYYVIQNPKIDKKNKIIIGLSIKTIEYKVRSWDKEYVYFEKNDVTKNKSFSETISFDKRYADAENEVYAQKSTDSIEKKQMLTGYAIFGEKKVAIYHKLNRLHSIASDLTGIYKALKGQQGLQPYNLKKEVKEATNGIDVNKIDLKLEEVKFYFDLIQNTNYFEEYDRIQSDFPDLASM